MKLSQLKPNIKEDINRVKIELEVALECQKEGDPEWATEEKLLALLNSKDPEISRDDLCVMYEFYAKSVCREYEIPAIDEATSSETVIDAIRRDMYKFMEAADHSNTWYVEIHDGKVMIDIYWEFAHGVETSRGTGEVVDARIICSIYTPDWIGGDIEGWQITAKIVEYERDAAEDTVKPAEEIYVFGKTQFMWLYRTVIFPNLPVGSGSFKFLN